MVVEVAGGLLTQSLALLSEAAHMFTDVAALSISLMAINIGKRIADRKRSFGYYRFEILAAAFNAFLLFRVAILYPVRNVRKTERTATDRVGGYVDRGRHWTDSQRDQHATTQCWQGSQSECQRGLP